MAFNRGHGVNRVLEKLKSCVDNGNFYEAHQMYRTLYFRYIAQKKYAELLDLLYDGAVLLLKKDQKESGADLAILLIDVLNKSGTVATDETIEKIARLYRLMSPESPERGSYIQAALKWSRRAAPESNVGHPKLHELIALTLWKEKNYSLSRYHFLHSTDGDGCASMLVDYHIAKGYSSEVDLFIAQAVLQYLCLRNKATATVVFYRYTEQHPDIVKGPPFLLPLLNFLWFLLLAVESGKLTVFTVLCEQYQPSIGRDPSYTEYLDRIGQLFFGLPPPKPKSGGVLGNLLQSLMGGLHDADDTDTEASLSLPGSSNTSIASATTTTALETEELD